ncbi:MAG: oligopeptide/dipeptide ABC transporter ATP-binding protein [Acidimicrobiales bacterium]
MLHNVSLGVATGEIVAVVGESGCGKTTLGKLMVGLLQPSSGTIRFDGRDIRRLKGKAFKAWRRSVQMVHQDPYGSLNPGVNIASTLGPALLHHKLATRRDLQGKMLGILRQVGLDATPDFLRRYPHQLSGGQRQRVAIARAVSLQPRLIVADEVTSMLDVSMRVAILDLLLSFREEWNITYVFISHDLGVVRYFTQGGRIVVMFYGVVVEQGPAEEIFSNPRHPYTYLLLLATPVPDPALAAKRAQATGGFAEISEGGPASVGCVFSNRCPFAEDKCHQSRPALVEVSTGHSASCFFAERVPAINYLHGEESYNGATSSPPAHENGTGPVDPVSFDQAGKYVES